MSDIDIKDFQSITGLTSSDSILVVQSSGLNGKIAYQYFKTAIASAISPTIKDGYWYIGDNNTNVNATAKIPILRKGENGIEWAYQGESQYTLLVNYSDLALDWDSLTPNQLQALKLKFSDLTAEDIALLQKPATDAVAAYQVEEEQHAQWYASTTNTWNNWYSTTTSTYNTWYSQAQSDWNTLKTDSQSATNAANKAAQDATSATEKCQSATDLANEMNNNPWKIDQSTKHIMVYDTETKTYKDTGVMGMLYPEITQDGNDLIIQYE